MLRPRNFAARSPLLRKGGVHQESKSNLRSQSRQALEDQILDWENQRNEFDENDQDDEQEKQF